MMREYSGLRFQTVDTHPAHKGSCLKSVRIKATSFLILTLCSFGWVTAITPDELPLQVEKGEPYTIKQDATTATLYNLERARKLLFSNKKEEVDIDRAAEHLLEAANEGHPEAQYLLGMMFSFGLGALPRSPAHSLVYETFGARGGSMHAIQALAFRRTEGIGVLRDCASGILHYDRVAAHIIHEYETRNLRQAEMFHGEVAARRRLRNHSTRASVTIQDSDVAAFYEHTAANGDSDAMMMLGYAYMYGSWGLTRNGKRAQEYFQRALDKGAGSARGALGALFHRGIDSQEGAVLSNHTLAEAYYQDGYQNYNDTVSQNGLGQMALDRGSTHEAYEHFLSTAQAGNGEGMYQLAMMLRDPDLWLPSSTTDPTNSESSGPRESRLRSSHLRNIRRSVRFLWKAAQQLVLPAIFELARIYGGIMKSDGTLLRTHSATQSNWNNVGGSNEEDSVSSMGSRALQCATSRDLYRTVMYHSIEHQETAKEAEELYESREYIPALIRYLHLSELGYEVGHANAAYLIRSVLSDQDLSMLFLGLSSPGLDGTVSESIASKVHPAPVHSTGPARSNESSIRSIELLQLRQALVVELLEREVHHKSPSAILELGHAYLNGHGVPKSADSARLFYQKASDLGNAEANHSLGYLYHYGIGVPRDYGKALQYYEKAAEMDPAIWWTRHLTRAWVWIEQFRENPRETLIETMHGLWSLLSNRVRLDVSSHKMEGNREGKEKNENVPASENKRPKRTEGNVVPATTQEDGHTEGSSSMPSKDDTQDTHSTIKVKTDDSENQNSTVKGEDASESSKFDSEKLWTALVMLEDFVLWLSIVFVTLLIYIRCTVDMH